MTNNPVELQDAIERVEATIHKINGHWWNRRKRPEAPDLRTILAALSVSGDMREALGAVAVDLRFAKREFLREGNKAAAAYMERGLATVSAALSPQQKDRDGE